MKTDTDSIDILSCPVFVEKTEEILSWLKGRTEEELQKMWKCNDNIAAQNIARINSMNLYKQLTPAVLAYEGIAYQYMAPVVFENAHFDYVQEHLRIMSAFYGVLKPMPVIVGADGIESDIPINLSGEEALKLKESADALKNIIDTLEL